MRRNAGLFFLVRADAHPQRERHCKLRLVCDHGRGWLPVARGSRRSEYDLFGVAIRRADPLRQGHRAGAGAPAAARQRRGPAALELGFADHHQPALSHAPVFCRQQIISLGRSRRYLEGDLGRFDPPDRPQQAAGDGKSVGARRGGKEFVDLVLRKYYRAVGVSKKGRINLRRNRRWIGSGDERRRDELDEVRKVYRCAGDDVCEPASGIKLRREHSVCGLRSSQGRRLQTISAEVDGCGQDLDFDRRRPAGERSRAGLRGRYGESESSVCGHGVWRVLHHRQRDALGETEGRPPDDLRPRYGDPGARGRSGDRDVWARILCARRYLPATANQARVSGADCNYVPGEGCADVYRAASAGRARQRISGRRVFHRAEPAVWRSVYDLLKGKDQDEKRNAPGRRERGGKEKRDAALSLERRVTGGSGRDKTRVVFRGLRRERRSHPAGGRLGRRRIPARGLGFALFGPESSGTTSDRRG